MIQLHIYFDVTPGKEADFEKAYRDSYVPAIKVQEGFRSTMLLRQYEQPRKYQIDIAFDTEELRAKWAASPQHQESWPLMESLADKVTWQGFDVVA